jgi:hypothetical protein
MFRSDLGFELVHAVQMEPGLGHLRDEQMLGGRDGGIGADEAVARAIELERVRLGFMLNL